MNTSFELNNENSLTFLKKSSLLLENLNKDRKSIIKDNINSNNSININNFNKINNTQVENSVKFEKPKFLKTIRSSLRKNLYNNINNNTSNFENKSMIKNKPPIEKMKNTLLASLKKTFEERLFWDESKIKEFQLKVKQASKLIKQKQFVDFEEINSYITSKNSVALKELLTSSDFMKFYKKEMNKTIYLSNIFKSGMGKLVYELLIYDSSFFNFDYMTIISLFEEFITKNNNMILTEDLDYKILENLLEDTIEYQLYRPSCIYLLAYLAALFKFNKQFRKIVSLEKEMFEEDFNIQEAEGKDLSENDIFSFSHNNIVLNTVIGHCLQNQRESMAVLIYRMNINERIDNDIVGIAIMNNSISFLKFIWEINNKKIGNIIGNIKFMTNQNIQNDTNLDKISSLYDDVFNEMKSISEIFPFTISGIVKNKTIHIERKSLKQIIEQWDYLENDRDLLDSLFLSGYYDEVLILVNRKMNYYWTFKSEYFIEVIKNKDCILITFFLERTYFSKMFFSSYEIQGYIVSNYMKEGNKIYYGTEMLSRIYKENWNQDLTMSLCKNILKCIKTKDIMNCHSPILTCVMLSEFLINISSISILHYSRVDKVIKELLQFCENIHNSSPNEVYIKFLMEQKNIESKNALLISAENDFYQVLSNHNIGTIVGKMWNGEVSYNSLFKASSLSRFLNDMKIRSSDPLECFEAIDSKKSYFFQLKIWQNSCSLRYFPESLFTILLVINYNLYIYFLSIKRGEYRIGQSNMDWNEKSIYFDIYYAQVTCINLNIVFQFIFSYVSDKKYKISNWNFLEIALFLLSSLLFIDFRKVFNDEEQSFKIGEFTIITILSILDIAVWGRITGILLTWKNLGPVIRMIYLMAKLLIKYIIIYSLFIICMSAVFTAIFFGSTTQFNDFTTSLITLISPFIQSFNTENFEQNKLFGQIMIMIYTALTAIMLINLLIAILSNVYDDLSKQVDASHRAVLIKYNHKLEWSSKYGYIIFLPNPLNICNLIIFPIQLLLGTKNIKRQERLNNIICRIYFIIFYFPIILSIFILYTILIYPICYVKCIYIFLQSYILGRGISNKKPKSIKIIFKYFFFTPFYLAYYNLRDIYNVVTFQFIGEEKKENSIERIKNFISKEDIIVFLDFIHNRASNHDNTLNGIFIDYIEYERNVKMEVDIDLKQRTEYLEKLNIQSKVKNINNTTLMISNHIYLNKNHSDVIKKNLIIIEILENFLIEDDSDEFYVDIQKMKMLLPKGMIINDEYIKRLIHTDILSINSAVNKLKTSQNKFIQYQLINKITNSIIKIDKEIDFEIHRNISLRRFEKREFEKIDSNIGLKSMAKIMNEMYEYFLNKKKVKENLLLRNNKSNRHGDYSENVYDKSNLNDNYCSDNDKDN